MAQMAAELAQARAQLSALAAAQDALQANAIQAIADSEARDSGRIQNQIS